MGLGQVVEVPGSGGFEIGIKDDFHALEVFDRFHVVVVEGKVHPFAGFSDGTVDLLGAIQYADQFHRQAFSACGGPNLQVHLREVGQAEAKWEQGFQTTQFGRAFGVGTYLIGGVRAGFIRVVDAAIEFAKYGLSTQGFPGLLGRGFEVFQGNRTRSFHADVVDVVDGVHARLFAGIEEEDELLVGFARFAGEIHRIFHPFFDFGYLAVELFTAAGAFHLELQRSGYGRPNLDLNDRPVGYCQVRVVIVDHEGVPFSDAVGVFADLFAVVPRRLVGIGNHAHVVKAGRAIGGIALALEVVEHADVLLYAGAYTGRFDDQVVEEVRAAAGVHARIEEEQDFLQVGHVFHLAEVKGILDPLVGYSDVFRLFDALTVVGVFQFQNKGSWPFGFYHDPELVERRQVEWLGQFGQEEAVSCSLLFGIRAHFPTGVDLQRIAACRIIDYGIGSIDRIPG